MNGVCACRVARLHTFRLKGCMHSAAHVQGGGLCTCRVKGLRTHKFRLSTHIQATCSFRVNGVWRGTCTCRVGALYACRAKGLYGWEGALWWLDRPSAQLNCGNNCKGQRLKCVKRRKAQAPLLLDFIALRTPRLPAMPAMPAGTKRPALTPALHIHLCSVPCS